MWICLECGRFFCDPINWQEAHGLDVPPYEPLSGCPFCCDGIESNDNIRIDSLPEEDLGTNNRKRNSQCDHVCQTPVKIGFTCCGAGNITQAERCGECGNYTAIEAMEEGLCKVCQLRVLKEFRSFVESFSDAARRYLNAVYDGSWF